MYLLSGFIVLNHQSHTPDTHQWKVSITGYIIMLAYSFVVAAQGKEGGGKIGCKARNDVG